ncbi:heavy metal-associated isoprenylated plant protein 3-like [Capsicum chacoense]|uniref:HMA domain-containing protein n=1 Tax=Capsicum annuum TaxID=4072 RepID=A0A2G2ZDP8_CAPAN|nr:heavy metal-associated isoprenylated plant protein 3-like [Capsicum annuum]KAF3634424.1 putative transcription factor RAX3-like [Capsicum annuum]PHT80074.1 hypothetical protein T459_18126 [Capsicum annuum]
MGKKKNRKNAEGELMMKNVEGEMMKSEEQQVENEVGGKTEEANNRSVVLKLDLHCEGCVRRIIKAVRSFKGVEKVTCDGDTNKVTAIGEVDALKLKERVEKKLKRPVQLIYPLQKDCKKEKQKNEKGTNGEDKKAKEKEPPVTTAVLKVHLHCEGCIKKIQKIITNNKGYKEMKMDFEKDLVTVTGAMDMKELVEALKKQGKKEVQIVPPKKEKEGGEKQDGGGGGKRKGKEKDGQGGGDGGDKQVQYEHQDMEATAVYVTQMLSDENTNACSIM